MTARANVANPVRSIVVVRLPLASVSTSAKCGAAQLKEDRKKLETDLNFVEAGTVLREVPAEAGIILLRRRRRVSPLMAPFVTSNRSRCLVSNCAGSSRLSARWRHNLL